jgi:MFS family permease
MRKALIGAVVTTLVVLLARSLAYATEPTPTARLLEQRVGGPALPVLALAVLALGAAIAVAVCWLAAVAVRERALIERRRAEAFPAFRVVALTLALALTTSVGGGLLEAYLHWRAGLGWHGLHCLLGPVHHDLIPFETGLSFVGAAVVAAAAHVVAWMRRTFARLGATLPRLWPVSSVRLRALEVPAEALCLGSASARAPPALG